MFECWGQRLTHSNLEHALGWVAQLCPAVCNPMDCSPPGSSVHGILQAKILKWVAMSSSRGPYQPRDWTHISHIADRFFTNWATLWECHMDFGTLKKKERENCFFSSVQLLSHVRLFVTPWTAARHASLSTTNTWSLPKLMFIESVMPFNHLIYCRRMLLRSILFLF